MTSSSHPFNIKAVVRDTGVLADTIRAWERRFDILSPLRTEGGHRRYSLRDIDTIHWLKRQTRRGLSISAAVVRFQALQAEGTDPLTQDLMVAPMFAGSLSMMDELRTQWVKACLTFDEDLAEAILTGAFARFPPEEIVLNLLLAGLAEIGAAWQATRATIQQEHFVSQLVTRRLEALIAMTPRATRRERMIVALPPGETHAIASLASAYLLRMRGFPVINLGANVPENRIQETVDRIRPALIILSAQTLPGAKELQSMAAILAEIDHPVAYGGRFFNRHPRARESVAGTFLGESLKLLPDRVEEILREKTAPPIPAVMSQEDTALLQTLLHTAQSTEHGLWEQLERKGWDFFEANHMFLYTHTLIDAALNLGSLSFLGASHEEFLILLTASSIGSKHALEFVTVYQTQLQIHIPELGRRLKAYLDSIHLTG
ncbi:MAG: MerR family transcriptional regulator [Anaerolineales bacterium]|nr:MerR family transcriptional regulator [Anaerolineales bacterium]